MTTLLKLLLAAVIGFILKPERQPYIRKKDLILYISTCTLVGIILKNYTPLLGLVAALLWIGLAMVLQRMHSGIRKWAIGLWLVYGLVGIIGLSIGGNLWLVAGAGALVGFVLLRLPSWMTEHGQKSYKTTLQFKKLTTIDHIFSIAKNYQLTILDHRINQARNYELTLQYESYPIRHHLFVRAIVMCPSIKKISTRE